MARCTSAAATAESTPPDSPQMARPSPTCSRIAATCSSTMLSMVQEGRQPASSRKRARMRVPCSVCMTSGWNWTPNSPSVTFSMAATGVASVCAVTVKPDGAAVAVSPWDIQTAAAEARQSIPPRGAGERGGSPPQEQGGSGGIVPPDSTVAVLPGAGAATVPPRPATMSWKP